MTEQELDYRFWLAIHSGVLLAQTQAVLSAVSVVAEFHRTSFEIELAKAKSAYASGLASLLSKVSIKLND